MDGAAGDRFAYLRDLKRFRPHRKQKKEKNEVKKKSRNIHNNRFDSVLIRTATLSFPLKSAEEWADSYLRLQGTITNRASPEWPVPTPSAGPS